MNRPGTFNADSDPVAGQASPAGGPQTLAGKIRSRQNALRHGLSATTLLTEALGPERLKRHQQRLCAEWQPRSGTEEFLIREMARHAAALELVEEAELAVLRSGARTPLPMLGQDTRTDSELLDERLTAAISSDAPDRVTRYRRAHEKGFFAALRRLGELRSVPPSPPTSRLPAAAPRLATEADCASYLRARLEREQGPCPRCGPGPGYWLSRRGRWECGRCGRQIGLRTGTILARSPLPLSVWFRAIEVVLRNPDCAARELVQKLGMRRLATVRHLVRRIRAALESPRRTILLAGLDQVHGQNP